MKLDGFDGDNVTKLNVGFKKPADEQRMFEIVPTYGGCREHHYLIDPEADCVTCKVCEKTFNTMAVLVDLARKESRWMHNLRDYHDRMSRLAERERTKCQCCGQMTKISK